MSFLSFLFKKKQMNVLMCGLDNAGKTSLLLKMQGEDPKSVGTKPTVGYLNPCFKYKTYEWLFWDVSGAAKFRGLWRSYYPNCRCVSFVIDLADSERTDEAIDALKNMLKDPEIKDLPFLILLNKTDLKAHDKAIDEKIGLNETLSKRCKIFACSAYSGEGVFEGLDWLCYTMKKNSKK
ncbi:ADP-ribosylation factor, putative [Entamoeba invadens IP1]|uniref:ADP-ribosylation factor, putative n=1 Tax=Entamoeba invadens IP1 TaxID=370355 RepID=A0A0A1U3M6_ENTIV|nr:ADP-ribosylation factor, putative [Entamoeba invadens IP1]ELP86186.1 ADP-ribosylation factor, putative [Entamoeba invadens IP1]|eukprot:XP_004185532.1 ADP-ribosylation factor, putative [Entamoeba invadens IP1]